MLLVGNVFVDVFIHRQVQVNFRIQLRKMNAQCVSDNQHVIIRDAQRTAFNLGNSAARGVVPAGKLQSDSKYLLRPAVFLAQFDDLPSNQVQLLHFRFGSSTANSQGRLL